MPVLEAWRHASLFIKTVASVVLVAFLSFTLHPLAIAANLPATPVAPAPVQKVPSNEEKLARTLHALEARLDKFEQKLNRKEDANRDNEELRSLRGDLDGLDNQAVADFNRIEKQLQEQNLPAVIHQRHRDAVAAYRKEMDVLKANLDGIHQAKEDDDRKSRVKQTKDHLKAKQKKRGHKSFDPAKLPFQRQDNKGRQPKLSDEELRASLFPERIQVASTSLTGDMLIAAVVAAPTPADLAPTEDIQITDAVKAKATELGHNPVKIYNWVRNNIKYLPTHGSIQGSDMTLQAEQGNAFDTASLLIALLRASNIPARYVYGAVEVPIDKAMNWVGGVSAPKAAQSLMAQGGIPNVAVVAGGRITHLRLEHVWVEAFVDFYPSRGAVYKQGDTWVAMDASFKQYLFTPGMDIKTNVPFDASGLANQIQATATTNTAEGWVQGINVSVVENALASYQTQVQNFIDATKPAATLGDVIGDQTIVADQRTTLAASLPYRIIATGNRYSTLPANLRHQLQLAVYASALDRALDSPAFMFSTSLAAVAGKKISLVYEGASATDQAMIDNAMANRATSLPAYLIRVKPVLKIEAAPVASGPSVTMGEPQTLAVTITTPSYSRPHDYDLTAGDFMVFGLNPAGITKGVFDKRTTQHDLRQGDHPDFTAEMFHQIALAWWGEKYAFNRNIGDVNGVRSYQLPSHTIAGAPLTVHFFFGIARSASYASRVIDAKEDLVTAEHIAGDAEKTRTYMLSIGQLGSFLEGNIFEQAFLMEPQGQAISTISVWKLSNDQNIPIYTITQDNVATALPQILTDADAKAEIANAVAAGLRVTVPQRDITVGSFTGTGYFIEDPVTGAGAYTISGGRNGGSAPAPESCFPVPNVPASPILGMLVGSSLRQAGMNLVIRNGVIAAVTFPPIAVPVGAAALILAAKILAAILLILLLIFGIAWAIDTTWPRTYKRIRHYTNATFGILSTRGIFWSPLGTFGPGVYVADTNDEDRRLVGCPPNGLDVATRFQIPAPGAIDPSRVTGFIDLAITRENLYKIDVQINSAGQAELIVRFPLIPLYHPVQQKLVPALYFGPLAPAIELEGFC